MVGNWLYGVAQNTALKAKAMGSKRRAKEREAAARTKPNAPAEVSNQLLALLDQQLQALPDKYRAPIVLCDLEGKSLVRSLAFHRQGRNVVLPPVLLEESLSEPDQRPARVVGGTLEDRRLSPEPLKPRVSEFDVQNAPRIVPVVGVSQVGRIEGVATDSRVESSPRLRPMLCRTDGKLGDSHPGGD
jgi:hypothetical protein